MKRQRVFGGGHRAIVNVRIHRELRWRRNGNGQRSAGDRDNGRQRGDDGHGRFGIVNVARNIEHPGHVGRIGDLRNAGNGGNVGYVWFGLK